MKPKPFLFFVPALVLITEAFTCGGQLSAQEVGGPAVSTDALKSVAAPEVKSGVLSSSPGTATTGNATGIDFPGKTDLDDPGATDPRFLVPVDPDGKATVTRLSKIDLDADLDYDGTFDNDSSSGQGAEEYVPPGLEIGVGEVSRLLVRFKTYDVEFTGKLVVSLEVTEVNRSAPSGDGKASVGQVRVWRDQAGKDLLIDSADPNKRKFDWTYDSEKRSGGIPRTLYVEGVKASPESEGDIRVLVSSSHVGEGVATGTPSSLFQSAFDHVLVTVRDKPVEKEFINNNVEGVWSMVGQASTPVAAAGEESAEAAPQQSSSGDQ